MYSIFQKKNKYSTSGTQGGEMQIGFIGVGMMATAWPRTSSRRGSRHRARQQNRASPDRQARRAKRIGGRGRARDFSLRYRFSTGREIVHGRELGRKEGQIVVDCSTSVSSTKKIREARIGVPFVDAPLAHPKEAELAAQRDGRRRAGVLQGKPVLGAFAEVFSWRARLGPCDKLLQLSRHGSGRDDRQVLVAGARAASISTHSKRWSAPAA
jgi:hypothetical protein